jgi:stage III sporulation protein SpoIIIAA
MSRVAIDGFDKLLTVLPFWMREPVTEYAETLEEVCLDKGKRFCLKLTDGFEDFERVVEQDDLEHLMCEVGMARSDGRTGIDGTLHRVAAITNRYGAVTGYTIRVGRYLKHVATPLRDLIVTPKSSVAFFGPPGSGKSTLIRSVTAMLAEEYGPRLCVVDSSNEIAGDGDTPHTLLQSGRRLQVPNPEQLAAKLIEGLINHGPSVMIVDELARPDEVTNIIRIIKRGVRVIACLHGDTIDEIVRNPDYEPLLVALPRFIETMIE